jgi:hypothetical protein
MRKPSTRRVRLVMTVALTCLMFSACARSSGPSPGPGQAAQSSAPSSAIAEPSSPSTASGSGEPQVGLIWNHIGKFFGEPQVWYVARLRNPGSSPAYLTVSAKAFDGSGTIVGSNEGSPPAVPPHGTFDYFGYVGGGSALDTPLTGTPVKVTVEEGELATDGWDPLLTTSDARLTRGDTDTTYTDAKYAYNLSVAVTNQTDQKIGNTVTQQVVLYDSRRNVVGGDTGTSHNKPAILKPGERYREVWTGIPAVRPASSVQYSVWP